MRIWFRNVRVTDPSTEGDIPESLVVRDGIIESLGEEPEGPCDRIVEGEGRILAPGLTDLHVHLREPGFTHKETILTGMRAAAAGGFVQVAAMPNTRPAMDRVEVLNLVAEKASQGPVRVLPVAAISEGLAGEVMTDMASLTEAGACAFSDDGMPVMDSAMMASAMCRAAALGKVVIDHCEDQNLSRGGAMHRGTVSEELGLPGIPAAAEDIMTARNICLAREFGVPVHIAHVSTGTSVELIRRARQEGLKVTGEAAPHHFSLTHGEVRNLNPVTRVNPPLRTEEDRLAVIAGLQEGVLSVIATDHAPHSREEKSRPYREAPNGMTGLETCVGVVFTYLVHPGLMPARSALAALSVNPCRILGIPGGTLRPGDPADLILIDPELEWTVQEDEFHSMAVNSPYLNRRLKGRTVLTMIGGQVVMQDNEVFF